MPDGGTCFHQALPPSSSSKAINYTKGSLEKEQLLLQCKMCRNMNRPRNIHFQQFEAVAWDFGMETALRTQDWCSQELAETGRMHKACKDEKESQSSEEKVDKCSHPQPRHYLQLTPTHKWKLLLFPRKPHWVYKPYFRAAPCRRGEGQNTMNSKVFLESLGLIFALLWHFFFFLNFTGFFLVYHGFWFGVFMDLVCVCLCMYAFLVLFLTLSLSFLC